jgi:hypothetical protein
MDIICLDIVIRVIVVGLMTFYWLKHVDSLSAFISWCYHRMWSWVHSRGEIVHFAKVNSDKNFELWQKLPVDMQRYILDFTRAGDISLTRVNKSFYDYETSEKRIQESRIIDNVELKSQKEEFDDVCRVVLDFKKNPDTTLYWDGVISIVHHQIKYMNSLEKFKWAVNENIIPINERIFFVSALNGNLRILQWLRSHPRFHQLLGEAGEWARGSSAAAAYCGDINMLTWLHTQVPSCQWGYIPCCLAAYKGHFETLKWLRSSDESPCPWNHKVCNSAAAGGHLEILKWLIEKNCPVDYISCGNTAAKHGYIDILKWLHSMNQLDSHMSMHIHCAEGGHIDIMKWLLSIYPINIDNYDTRVCVNASSNGHLGMLQYLRSLDTPVPWNEEICYHAIRCNHLHVLKWLRSQDPPCPWNLDECKSLAMNLSKETSSEILDWINYHSQ